MLSRLRLKLLSIWRSGSNNRIAIISLALILTFAAGDFFGQNRVRTPIDEALMGVAKRMNSEDLEWAVTALSIQRVVGGSMATILTTTYETVKARSEIRREVRSKGGDRWSVIVSQGESVTRYSFFDLKSDAQNFIEKYLLVAA